MRRLLVARVDPALRNFAGEVLAGLRATPKTLSAKFFYDDRGARLFESICEQPEYYLTRAEIEILRGSAREIAALAGSHCSLVEYGSGAGTKIRLLLDALDRPESYTPVDISHRQLTEVSKSIGRDYPELAVHPVCADYTRRFALPRRGRGGRRVAFFPGSTIGNFDPVPAISFLQHVRQIVGPDGALIVGVDRVKETATLNAAYNDANGVTAEFNLNVLARLNRELGANFDLARFHHVAFFNEQASRIEMHLESLGRQTVVCAGQRLHFEAGETIWTESSFKYDFDGLEALVTAAGFRITRIFTDSGERFWVVYLTVAPTAVASASAPSR